MVGVFINHTICRSTGEGRLMCVCACPLSFSSLSPSPSFHYPPLLLTIDPSLPSQLDLERQGIRFELEDLQNGPMVEPLLTEMIHMVGRTTRTDGLTCTTLGFSDKYL